MGIRKIKIETEFTKLPFEVKPPQNPTFFPLDRLFSVKKRKKELLPLLSLALKKDVWINFPAGQSARIRDGHTAESEPGTKPPAQNSSARQSAPRHAVD